MGVEGDIHLHFAKILNWGLSGDQIKGVVYAEQSSTPE